jgi:hypothetical protein
MLGLVTASLAKRPEDRPPASQLVRELLPGEHRLPSQETIRQLPDTDVGPPVPPSPARRRRGLAVAVVAILVAAAVAAFVLSRPGSPKAVVLTATTTAVSATTSTTVSLAALGQQYLSIIGPANDAFFKFTMDLDALPRTATGADVARLAAPALAATRTVIQALLRVSWPEPVRTDVRALVAADSQLITDLTNSDLQTRADATRQFTQDIGKTELAGSTVRADLSLPPPKA